MKRSAAPSPVKGPLALWVALSVVPLVAAGCRATSPARPAPPASHAEIHGATAVPPAAGGASEVARRGYAEADVHFMQRMIGHHGQALTMTALVPERSRNEALRLVAERIAVSQRDEMAAMRRWLASRREVVPADDAHEGHRGAAAAGGDHAHMPGMLSTGELDRLAVSTGAAFDDLFVQYMIRHHEGALTMVAELFSASGAGQEPELFRLASDVDADQRAEIARLRALRLSSASPPHHP